MITKKCKKTILLPAGIGDWTKYKPQISEIAKLKNFKPTNKSAERDILNINLTFIEIFEQFATALQKNCGLPSLTLLSCSIESNTYDNILKSMDIPVVQFKIMKENFDSIFLCLDMTLSNAIINTSVGGPYEISQSKALTEIEENIIEIAASSCANKLFFEESQQIEAKYINSPNFYFDQSIDETSLFILAKGQFSFGKFIGNVFLVFSNSDIQHFQKKNKTKSNAFDPSRLPTTITNKITMPVIAFLGNTSISAKELYNLENGDVIVLDSSINNLLPIVIGNELNLTGQPGIKNDRICVQILKSGTSRIEKVKQIANEENPVAQNYENIYNNINDSEQAQEFDEEQMIENSEEKNEISENDDFMNDQMIEDLVEDETADQTPKEEV